MIPYYQLIVNLLCYHSRPRSFQTSSIKSFEGSDWKLPHILSIFEGGNSKFLTALNPHQNSKLQRSPSFKSSYGLLRRSSSRRSSRTVTFADELLQKEQSLKPPSSCPFELRYKDDYKAQMYKNEHALNVTQAIQMNVGNCGPRADHCDDYGSSHIITESEFNNGSSLAMFLVHKGKQGTLTSEWTNQILSPLDDERVAPCSNAKQQHYPHPSTSDESKEISRSVHNFFIRMNNENNVRATISDFAQDDDDDNDVSTVCTYKSRSHKQANNEKKKSIEKKSSFRAGRQSSPKRRNYDARRVLATSYQEPSSQQRGAIDALSPCTQQQAQYTLRNEVNVRSMFSEDKYYETSSSSSTTRNQQMILKPAIIKRSEQTSSRSANRYPVTVQTHGEKWADRNYSISKSNRLSRPELRRDSIDSMTNPRSLITSTRGGEQSPSFTDCPPPPRSVLVSSTKSLVVSSNRRFDYFTTAA